MTDQNAWQTGEALPKRKLFWTPWHDLPPHIKITYQSQAQYERAIDAQKGHKVT